MAVRSISASISACAARTAPRTISSVTGSQAVGAFLSVASGMLLVLAARFCRRRRKAFVPHRLEIPAEANIVRPVVASLHRPAKGVGLSRPALLGLFEVDLDDGLVLAVLRFVEGDRGLGAIGPG